MSDPPATLKCEACESHDRKCKSQCSIDRMTHHAEIAELRALLERITELDFSVGTLMAEARVLLDEKEGKP